MNPDSPQFLTFFAVAWVVTAAYAICFIKMTLRRRFLNGETPRTIVQAFTQGTSFSFGEMKFLYTGEHHRIGDAALSRLVMVTRMLQPVSIVLILTMFILVFTGGATDAG